MNNFEPHQKCPHCGTPWTTMEVQSQECDTCGYPESDETHDGWLVNIPTEDDEEDI